MVINLKDIIPDQESVDGYLTFRYIEDWCSDHFDKTKWRFDYSTTLCVCGIDIPGRIFFWNEEDASVFRQNYRIIKSTDLT